MKTTPSSSSISWMPAMFGCETAAAARASLMNRERRSASSAKPGGRTLRATCRWSFSSNAL